MLGRSVFFYLKSKYPNYIWGTHREKIRKGDLLKLNAQTLEADFKSIFKKLKRIDYVINCIGIVKENQVLNTLIETNGLFPHKLERLAEQYNFKLIHVSTDAVFSETAGAMNEKNLPAPTDNYGLSKLAGETTSENAITFRTSVLGLDPIDHKGLLEWILGNKKTIKGYVNQIWSGCTVLQFAKLCEEIISKKKFGYLRKKSPFFHFAPLGPITKYQIIKVFLEELGRKKILKRAYGTKMTRTLKTLYFDYLSYNSYTNKISLALKEVIDFEKT